MSNRIQKWAGIVLLTVFVVFSAWAVLLDSNTGNQSIKTPFTILSANNVSDLHIKGSAGTGGLDIVLESTPAGLAITVPGGGSIFLPKTVIGGDLSFTGVGSGDGSGFSNLLATTTIINNVFTTNQYVDFINSLSNAFITYNTTIRANKGVIISNLFAYRISSFVGPSNTYDISKSRQEFTMTSDAAITNFTGATGTGTDDSSVLSLTNSTGSDHTFWITASGVTDGDGASSFVVTNQSQRKISLNHDDHGYHSVSRPFWK